MTQDFKSVDEAINYAGPDRVVHFTQYLLDKAGQANRSKSFSCWFEKFDKAVGGLDTGQVVVITGYTKNGKTLFAESWVRSMARKDPSAKAMILSFEVQAEKMLIKYMNEESLPVHVPMELQTMDFDWLKRRCMEAKFKYGCRIILIDHLHFLVDMQTKQNMSLNIGAFMRRLKKDIAIDLDLAVILIAHQGQPKEGQDASLSNIRDSSFVGQESDSTIIVSRRKNLDAVEMVDAVNKLGDAADILRPPADAFQDDPFSSGLAVVKVACHRKTGVYDWKKMFQKRGDFLVEV